MSVTLTRDRLLQALPETTYGTVEAIGTPPLALHRVFTLGEVDDSTAYLDDEGMYGLGPEKGTPGAFTGTLTFSTYVFGATSDAWADALLPACNMVDVAGVFTPTRLHPLASGSDSHSLTFRRWYGGIVHVMRGCMGSFVIRAEAGQRVQADWTFQGVIDPQASVALPAYTRPTATPIEAKGVVASIGAFNLADNGFRSFALDIGNEVTLEEDATDAGGIVGAVVVNRRATLQMTVRLSALGTYNPQADFRASTSRAISIAIGTVGNRITIAAPVAMHARAPRMVDLDGVQGIDLEFVLARSGADGDDEVTITLD